MEANRPQAFTFDQITIEVGLDFTGSEDASGCIDQPSLARHGNQCRQATATETTWLATSNHNELQTVSSQLHIGDRAISHNHPRTNVATFKRRAGRCRSGPPAFTVP